MAPLILLRSDPLLKGGAGSGDHGHSGRPGRVGGSAPSGLAQVRSFGFPSSVAEPIAASRDIDFLRSHPAYAAAKAGQVDAASDLVADLVKPLVALLQDLGKGALLVAPHAAEANGDNAIPATLAAALAVQTGGLPDRSIVQENQVFHTGADPMERLISAPQFKGSVARGARYVLVDDVTTMGGTLAALADFVQSAGGRVVAAAVLVNASRSGRLAPDKRTVAKIKERYGDEIEKEFGIKPEALTADEARYLVGFRNVDEIRSRRAKAEKERNNRLRSKPVFFLKAIGPGERWITVKPHGDAEKGQPVLIREQPDGSAKVVGGAGGALNHLRLTGVRSELDFPHFSVAKGSRHGPEDVLARDELERLAY